MSLKLAGFLAHHVKDLHSIAAVAGSILDAVPVNAQDRERIEAGVDKLRTAAANIAESLTRVTSTSDDDKATKAPASGSKAPTADQIAKALDKALPAALAAYFAAHPVEAPAPVIAPGTPGPVARTAGEDAVGGDGTGTNGSEQHDDGTGRDRIEA